MNKVVLITGGSSGIGKSIGEYLHKKGFTVYGTSRNPERVEDSIFPLIALDVRNTSSIYKAVGEILAKSGRIDVLINNAGIVDYHLFENMKKENWDKVLELSDSFIAEFATLYTNNSSIYEVTFYKCVALIENEKFEEALKYILRAIAKFEKLDKDSFDKEYCLGAHR